MQLLGWVSWQPPLATMVTNIGKACLISPIVAPVIYYLGAATLMIVSPDNKSRLLGAFMFILFFGIPVSKLLH
jgi:hypothetical protein